MSLSYGFFNSKDGDRKYNTTDMSQLFDGLIIDGVFATIGNQFHVTPGNGLSVNVGTGRAWFNHTWTLNDSVIPLSVDAPDVLRDRIDTVVLDVNSDILVRANSIKIVKGEPDETPVEPTLTNTATLHRHKLALIYVTANATEFVSGNITNKVGTTDCPYVTGPVSTIDATTLFDGWDNSFDSWFNLIKASWNNFVGSVGGWDEWFDGVKGDFSDWFNSVTSGSYLSLTEDKWYYVRSDGVDSNTGLVNTAEGAFRTVQRAVDVASKLIMGNYTAIIWIGDGTYNENVILRSFSGTKPISITGNPSQPYQVYIVPDAGSCFSTPYIGSVNYTISGVMLSTLGDNGGHAIDVNGPHTIYLRSIHFSAVVKNHINIDNHGSVIVDYGGYVVVGNCEKHCVLNHNSKFISSGQTVQITVGNMEIGTWLDVSNCSIAEIDNMVPINWEYAIGKKFDVRQNGIIFAGGGELSSLPGGWYGTQTTGGQYVI
jgi:hypothetical protein